MSLPKDVSDQGELFPYANSRICQRLYLIEVSLRELIIERLSVVFGGKWLKQHLPGGGDVQQQLKEARAYERATPWTEHVPHHPVYYLDFPLLRQTIERNDNWERAFKAVFVRKDVVTGVLAGLEPIRNKVAHNRKATDNDLSIVEGAYSALVSSIEAARGPGAFEQLVLRCTTAEGLPGRLSALRVEARSAEESVLAFRPLGELSCWGNVSRAWWFDDEYLGDDISPIVEYFQVLGEYAKLPRIRGEGHRLEAWVRARRVPVLAHAADEVLSALTRSYT